MELFLGCWLVISPWVFGHAGLSDRMWNDVAAGLGVIAFSIASFWRPVSWAHYVTGIASLWLICFGYFASPRPGPPAAQNEIVTGILLSILFFLPNEASLPPESWRETFGDGPRQSSRTE
jgi:hypothetical protein